MCIRDREYIKDKLKEMVDKTKIYTTDIKENNNLFETSLVDEKYVNLEDLGLMPVSYTHLL